MNFYERYYYRYSSSDDAMKAKCREHWEKAHAENLASNREDLMCFSARMLEMMDLADGKLVQNCPRYFVNRVARNMAHYNLDLNDAFEEAIHAFSNKVNRKMRIAFNSGDYREYIPSAYLPQYLDFEKYPLHSI